MNPKSNHWFVNNMMNRFKKIHYFLLCLCLLFSSCSSIQPWVKPYERDKLADPIMNAEISVSDGGHRKHLYQSREGSRGGEGTSGGGCGCN